MVSSEDAAEDESVVEPYVHVPAVAGLLVQVVDAAFGTAVRWWETADLIRDGATGAGIDPYRPVVGELINAASYVLRLAHAGAAGCDLRPQNEHDGFAWPPSGGVRVR